MNGGVYSLSKIIQIGRHEVYLIGGHRYQMSLLPRDYDLGKACLRIDMDIREVSQRTPMKTSRFYFGICSIGHQIYVIGGMKVQACEVFNTLTQVWTDLPPIDEYCTGISAITIKRFIYGFGGKLSFKINAPDFERVLKFDTHKKQW